MDDGLRRCAIRYGVLFVSLLAFALVSCETDGGPIDDDMDTSSTTDGGGTSSTCPTCMQLECVPDGNCTASSKNGVSKVCWTNGVKAVTEGAVTTVTKNGKLCHTATSSFPGITSLVLTYRDASKKVVGIVTMNPTNPNTAAKLECGGQTYTLAQGSCGSIYYKPQCEVGACN